MRKTMVDGGREREKCTHVFEIDCSHFVPGCLHKYNYLNEIIYQPFCYTTGTFVY